MNTISKNLLRAACVLGAFSALTKTTWAEPTTAATTKSNSALNVERNAATVEALGLKPVYRYPNQGGSNHVVVIGDNTTVIINRPGGNTYPTYGYPTYGYPTYGYP